MSFDKSPKGGTNLLSFLRYLFEKENLRLLLLQWPALLLAGIASIEMLSRQLQGESLMKKHLVRKSFHALAICLFAPPLMSQQADFLAISQLVASLLFIALETCRVCKSPFFELQNRFLSKYLDKREDISHDLVLTHLYLLLGCSLPIWLELSQQSGTTSQLRQCSGLLLIGVGDSCAALFGIRFGKVQWPGSHRTFVGTLAFVISVTGAGALAMPALQEIFWPFFLTTLLAGLLEVYTQTVDNLALPLFFCAFLKTLEMSQSETSSWACSGWSEKERIARHNPNMSTRPMEAATCKPIHSRGVFSIRIYTLHFFIPLHFTNWCGWSPIRCIDHWSRCGVVVSHWWETSIWCRVSNILCLLLAPDSFKVVSCRSSLLNL